MEALLIKNDAWMYVTEERRKPAPGAENEVATWENEDRSAKSDVILSINLTKLKQIKMCNTSNEVWVKLRNIYQSQGLSQKVFTTENINVASNGR